MLAAPGSTGITESAGSASIFIFSFNGNTIPLLAR
jgi:hypothetical protein